MAELKETLYLFDTSVLIDPDPTWQVNGMVSAISIAELSYGVHAASEPAQMAIRRRRLEAILALYQPIPFSTQAAMVYGSMSAALRNIGRNPRPRRLDLMLAAVAFSQSVPLLTRNPKDFLGLQDWIKVVNPAE